MKATFAIADLFCGAGGTSTGACEAISSLGMKPKLTACDHWPVAVATHAANHPGARHLCADLDSLNPRTLYQPGELKGLWASPECTNHSRARRGKHINEQSRATAWCVTRWSDALRPGFIWVENVPEFRKWPSFAAWVACLESFGYRVDSRILVAADYGDPTTRRRLFVQAVRGKRRIVWPNATHGKEAGLFDLKPWVPASRIIDWGLPAIAISDRKRPLAAKTMKRINDGLEKHGGAIALIMEYYGTGGTRPVSEPLPTVTCRDRFALIQSKGGKVLFRMLKAHELAAAQGFRPDYKFTGNGSEITKQIGNAVPRRMARALVSAALGQSSDIKSLMEDAA